MGRLKIKVCGMRDPENIGYVESLDVDFLGFVFYSGSPRAIQQTEGSLTAICGCIKPKVGVFVNETLEYILDKAELYQLDYIQLHGDEAPALCCELQKRGYSVIKAFSIASAGDLKCTENYSDCSDYFLFDTKCASFGGSGKRFNWSLLNEYKGNIPFLLSGGLTPDCICDISQLEHLMFAGIDLNSGFELSPAMKDTEKLKNFIAGIRMSDFLHKTK